jgi:hypothetical protein
MLAIIAGYVITNYGCLGSHELWLLWCASCCVYILIQQLMVRQRNNSSSPLATTCFGHTTIIRRHTVVNCPKLFT